MGIVDRNNGPFNPRFFEIMTNPKITIPLGLHDGVKGLYKYGRSQNFPATVSSDLWTGAAAYTMPSELSLSENLSILSSDNSDIGIKITVQGLDENGKEQSEEITLNGTTPVNLTKKWYRAFRAFTSGSVEFVGVVRGFVTGTDSAVISNVRFLIPANCQQTMMAIWTVPADYSCVLESWGCALTRGGQDRTASICLKLRKYGGVFRTFSSVTMSTTGGGQHIEEYQPHIYLEPLTDIKIAIILASANDMQVTGQFNSIMLPTRTIPKENI